MATSAPPTAGKGGGMPPAAAAAPAAAAGVLQDKGKGRDGSKPDRSERKKGYFLFPYYLSLYAFNTIFFNPLHTVQGIRKLSPQRDRDSSDDFLKPESPRKSSKRTSEAINDFQFNSVLQLKGITDEMLENPE